MFISAIVAIIRTEPGAGDEPEGVNRDAGNITKPKKITTFANNIDSQLMHPFSDHNSDGLPARRTPVRPAWPEDLSVLMVKLISEALFCRCTCCKTVHFMLPSVLI